jgi:hypothetical protein
VRKGQTANRTTAAFNHLRAAGICPMPMLMHHDSQPLYTRKGNDGLINQIRLLRKAGAVSLQVLMMTPATGSKLYEQTHTSGQVIDSAAGRRVKPYMLDGNYVVASKLPRPWQKQINLLIAYGYFYNPLRAVEALRYRKTKLANKPVGMQGLGMLGLVQTVRRTLGWTLRLGFGRIRRCEHPPVSSIPVRHVDGQPACADSVMADVPD